MDDIEERWGESGFGAADGVEGKAHDIGTGTIQTVGRGPTYQQPRLVPNQPRTRPQGPFMNW